MGPPITIGGMINQPPAVPIQGLRFNGAADNNRRNEGKASVQAAKDRLQWGRR